MIHVALVLVQALAVADDPGKRSIPELGLSFDLRGLAELAPLESYGDLLAAWEGQVEQSMVHVQIVSRETARGITEPEDVTDMLAPRTLDDLLRAQPSGGKKPKDAEPRPAYLWPGPYGFVPYASIVSTRIRITAERVYDAHVLGGVLADRYYAVQVECKPPLGAQGNALVHDFLRNGIRYEGPLRDPEWTDEEVKRRWLAETRPEMHGELKKPIRTEHFIVLGNSSGGDLFAKKMEEFYDAIRKVYPFDEVPGRKLMPVFIFLTSDQYHDFLEDRGMTRKEAEATAGVAMSDLYSSVYEAPGDPVHLHEATHQVFRNRLRLGGGGSWFQEGVAEYMSTRSSERRSYAKGRAKDGTQVPFRDFFALSQLIAGGGQDEAKGGAARSNYLQAASIIEFVRESRRTRDRFQLFLHAIGALPRGDVAAIEDALRKIFDLDLDGFEAEWAKYWK